MASKSGSLSRLAPCASSQSTSPWRNRTPLITTPFGFGIFGSLKSLPRDGRALYRFTVQGYRALAALSSLLLSARLACGGAGQKVRYLTPNTWHLTPARKPRHPIRGQTPRGNALFPC